MLDITKERAREALEREKAEARAIAKRKNLSDAERADLKARVDRITKTEADLANEGPASKNQPWDGTSPDAAVKTLADLMSPRFKRDELETLHTAIQHGASYQAKAVQSTADLGPSGGTIVDLSAPRPALRDRVRLASLIPAQGAGDGGNQITYYRNAAKAAGAAAVAESGAKPQSSPEWEPITEPIRKVAHYAHVPDEAFQDYSGFSALLADEMMAGLIDEENDQILNGNGTPPNLSGILDRAGIITRAQGTDLEIDALLKAISDVRKNAFVEPDAVLMNATIYERFRLVKNAEEEYYFGNPTASSAKTVDGVPIIISSAVPALTVVTGRLASLRAYVRVLPTLSSSNSDGNDFVENKQKIRAEERFALAFPDGETTFCKLTLS